MGRSEGGTLCGWEWQLGGRGGTVTLNSITTLNSKLPPCACPTLVVNPASAMGGAHLCQGIGPIRASRLFVDLAFEL